ncbi:gametocyte-specific factor 1 [Caerostris darwini]|uniref:Gametocyte-specific factor 1 n=1 Tax=Caerostris darwini TaxID=1538125 RepID=A0AAV4UJV5_9ARAC|nr:gametocyte-specific factor 1 [Caerostris darwini]
MVPILSPPSFLPLYGRSSKIVYVDRFFYSEMSGKLIVCPYDEAHKVKASRMQVHITKCRLNFLNQPKFTCPFNASHVFPIQEKNYHLINCIDKAPLDRKLAESMDKNHPLKGKTAVSAYVPSNSDQLISAGEVWDIEDNTAGYVPVKERPCGAIFEPAPLTKPSSRKQLYMGLHQISIENESSTKQEVSSPIPAPVWRQPVQVNEVNEQAPSVKTLPSQGIKQGPNPNSKIAANIFPWNSNALPKEKSYNDAITTGMSNMSIGRGQTNNRAPASPLFGDDEFPALGVGRGMRRR